MSSAQIPLRIGKIKYLNCLPYYAGWQQAEKFSFEAGTPAEINSRMRAGELDIAPISSMEYLLQPQNYLLLPGFGIASAEFARSVTLFSKKKMEVLDGAKIAVTNESLTSVHLLQILLKQRFKKEAIFETMPSHPKTMLEQHDAALLIGNDALLAQPRKWIERYDLGNLWWEWQKLPFVYAVWVVRRDVAIQADSVLDFYQALKQQFLYNCAHLSELVQKHCSLGEFDRLYPKIQGYLSGLKYELDEPCMQGFQKFSELAIVQGWCGKPDWKQFDLLGSVSSTQPPIAL